MNTFFGQEKSFLFLPQENEEYEIFSDNKSLSPARRKWRGLELMERLSSVAKQGYAMLHGKSQIDYLLLRATHMSDFDKNKCLETMNKLIHKIEDEVPSTIYHYTKAEAFKGIIEDKEIWMTNALFVDDKAELRASLEGSMFRDVEFINPQFDSFKNESGVPESKSIEDYYLACFSEARNSFDQFRAYGNYCIGFDARRLKKKRYNLFRCVYKQEDIKNWIISKDKLPEWGSKCFDKARFYKKWSFAEVRFARQAKLKNKHYESEHEVRLLVRSNSSWAWYTNSPEMFCDQPAVYFRHHDKMNLPVPYVNFFIPKRPKTKKELETMVKGKSPIETKQIIRKMEIEQEKELLPINEIVIGPMQHQEEAVKATKILLLENGYNKVDVIPSDIPFRGY